MTKYVVNVTLYENGFTYQPGQEILVSQERAAQLIKAQVNGQPMISEVDESYQFGGIIMNENQVNETKTEQQVQQEDQQYEQQEAQRLEAMHEVHATEQEAEQAAQQQEQNMMETQAIDMEFAEEPGTAEQKVMETNRRNTRTNKK